MNCEISFEEKLVIRRWLAQLPREPRNDGELSMAALMHEVCDRLTIAEDPRRSEWRKRRATAYQLRMQGVSFVKIGLELGVCAGRAKQIFDRACWEMEREKKTRAALASIV